MSRRLMLMLLAFATMVMPMAAQRRVTPVPQPQTVGKSPERTGPDMSRLAEVIDSRGNIILVDTVTGTEWNDTTVISRIPRMEYPLVSGISVGVNVFDAVMRGFSQKWGLADASVAVMFHNRYFAVAEAGLGQCHDTPAGYNYTYNSPTAPYFKMGFDYNFFYNNSSDYQLTLGVRYGVAFFKYSLSDCTVDSGYWGTTTTFDIPSQTSTGQYGEIVLGLRVKVLGPVSMGWNVKWHKRFHVSGGEQYGPPMYIPGFGKWTGNFAAGFSIYVNFLTAKPVTTLSDS